MRVQPSRPPTSLAAVAEAQDLVARAARTLEVLRRLGNACGTGRLEDEAQLVAGRLNQARALLVVAVEARREEVLALEPPGDP